METNNAIVLKTTRGEFQFNLIIPSGATWANAIDATTEMYQHVCEMAKQAVAAQNLDQGAQEEVEGELVDGNQ